MSGARDRRRVGGCVSAGALIAGAVAVAFGTGFTASRVVLGDGGAWLSKGRTVTHVNAATGTADATVEDELVGEVGDQEIVVSDAGVAVVDTGASTVTSLDTTTMTAGSPAPLPPGATRPGYVVAGRWGYLVGERVVQPVDPVTLQPVGEPIEVGQVGGAVATADGTLAVLDPAAGTVVEVEDGRAGIPLEVSRDGRPDQLALTAVGGRAVVVDTAEGTVTRLVDGAVEDPVTVPELAGLSHDAVAVADPHADGSTLWLVVREPGTLLGVELETGRIRSGELDRNHRGPSVQSPVVLAGLVYVPHGDSHAVLVVDGTGDELRQIDQHEVQGESGRLEVFSHEGRVWINDPAGRRALAVESDGHTFTEIDKGSGHGVTDPGDESPPSGDTGPQPDQPGQPEQPVAGSPEPAPPSAPGTEGTEPPPVEDPPPPPQADVPNVVGLPYREACGLIRAAQLRCDERPTADAPDGTERDAVVSQDPTGGQLPRDSVVVVTYYAPDPVAVPDVRGQRVAQGGDPQQGPACQAILSAGLQCTLAPTAALPGQPADEVLSQEPSGGELYPGDTVTITYSPTALVPALSGDFNPACATVNELNLVCLPQPGGVGMTPGEVVGQNPPAGTALAGDSQVVVAYTSRRPVVPNVVGMNQTDACNTLAVEQLGCSWEVYPTNSVRNPGASVHQSLPPGSDATPGQVISVYHPAGPDVTLYRFQALTNGAPVEQWAINPSPSGPGRPVDWAPNGTVGRCYSSQVEGSIPLDFFQRHSPDDPNHEDHFYAANDGAPNGQYRRAIDYYGPARGTICFVVPWNSPLAPGAAMVTEWWKGDDAHFYNVGEGPPGAGYTQVFGHWWTW